MNLGSRIAAWRKSRGLSKRELAELVGVTRAAVYQWEGTGDYQTSPSLVNLEAIVKALGITMERFYGETPKTKAKSA